MRRTATPGMYVRLSVPFGDSLGLLAVRRVAICQGLGGSEWWLCRSMMDCYYEKESYEGDQQLRYGGRLRAD